MSFQGTVPANRIRVGNQADVDRSGDYVLYWMIANRRGEDNFSLQRAVDWSGELRKPIVVLEALRAGYRWASDRLHWFVIEGMCDNARYFSAANVDYFPYLETQPGEGRGLVEALARRACVIVSDDYPAFFLPSMLAKVAPRLPVRFELVDSNGLLPLRAARMVYARAHDFRRFLHRALPEHLGYFPHREPLANYGGGRATARPLALDVGWPRADLPRTIPEDPIDRRRSAVDLLAPFAIDHSVPPAPLRGGGMAGRERLSNFVDRIDRYAESRNDPDEDATSGLSPYLHFGHVAAHRVFTELMEREGWSIERLHPKPTGSREGWWNASPAAEGFLDELITWRELGFNMCWQRSDYDRYESLPTWAQATLHEHASDPRDYVYTLDEFAQAKTHDPLWNAAQRQLLSEGRIHNYLRMLWGKKILHWTHTPQDALAIMTELNNRYALDGRDPNSYSGIFWVLGRYDRPWGPERPIFGKVRYMTSENTQKKLKVAGYLRKYGPADPGLLFTL